MLINGHNNNEATNTKRTFLHLGLDEIVELKTKVAQMMKIEERQMLIDTLIAKAPAILSSVVSEMGYEFSAISASGFIEQRVGMLLASETGGNLPDFLEDETISTEDRNLKLELFFRDNLEITPYEELDDEHLLSLVNYYPL